MDTSDIGTSTSNRGAGVVVQRRRSSLRRPGAWCSDRAIH
jgi:hypothetical protein